MAPNEVARRNTSDSSLGSSKNLYVASAYRGSAPQITSPGAPLATAELAIESGAIIDDGACDID